MSVVLYDRLRRAPIRPFRLSGIGISPLSSSRRAGLLVEIGDNDRRRCRCDDRVDLAGRRSSRLPRRLMISGLGPKRSTMLPVATLLWCRWVRRGCPRPSPWSR